MVPTIDKSMKPAGYEQITDVSSASTLTVPTDATHALIQAVTKNVRWRDDGTSPTASVGIQLEAGKDLWYSGDLNTFEAIEEAASAEMNISYYKAR